MQSDKYSHLQFPGYLLGHFEVLPDSLLKSRTLNFLCRCSHWLAVDVVHIACM